MRNFDNIVSNILYEDVVLEEGVMDKIKEMLAKGLSIATIAASLALPFAVVQDAAAKTTTPSNKYTNFTPVPMHSKKHVTSTQSKKTVTPVVTKKKNSYNNAVDTIARTIYAEAGGESYTGKRAVASVLINRADGDVNKLVKVAKAPKQFSCWNSGYIARGVGKAWDESVLLAKLLLSGKFKPNVDATHYYAYKKVNPSWAQGIPKTKIGNHMFLSVENVEEAM